MARNSHSYGFQGKIVAYERKKYTGIELINNTINTIECFLCSINSLFFPIFFLQTFKDTFGRFASHFPSSTLQLRCNSVAEFFIAHRNGSTIAIQAIQAHTNTILWCGRLKIITNSFGLFFPTFDCAADCSVRILAVLSSSTGIKLVIMTV